MIFRWGEVCDKWIFIEKIPGKDGLWWCKHNIGIMASHLEDEAEIIASKERHAEKVQEMEAVALLKSICSSFIFRRDVINPVSGWYCSHGFLITTLTSLALDNLRGWHYNHIKDKEELRDKEGLI